MKSFYCGILFAVFITACSHKTKDAQSSKFAVEPAYIKGYAVRDFPKTDRTTTAFLFQNKEEFEALLLPNQAMSDSLTIPDFDLDYILMLSHKPSTESYRFHINQINKKGDQFRIRYELQKDKNKLEAKVRALTLFSLPKDQAIKKVVFISSENDSVSYSTQLQNMPPIQLGDTYKGIIPCADCPGITTILQLSYDFKEYELTQIYGDASSVFVNRGKLNTEKGFGKDQNATVFILDMGEKVEKQRYFVRLSQRPDEILMLSPTKEIINSSLNYSLQKLVKNHY